MKTKSRGTQAKSRSAAQLKDLKPQKNALGGASKQPGPPPGGIQTNHNENFVTSTDL